MKNRTRKDSQERLLPQVGLQIDIKDFKKKLRRWRTVKKIAYAAAIMLITILIYATTSSNDYIQEVNKDWQLPLMAHNQFPVDPKLYEPLHRLPLGPFQVDPPTVVIEEPEAKPVIRSFLSIQAKVDTINISGSSVNKLSPVGGANSSKPIGAPNANAAKPSSATVNLTLGTLRLAAPALPALPKPPAAAPVSNHVVPKPTIRAPMGNALPMGPIRALPDLSRARQEMARRLNHTRIMCDFLKIPNNIETDIYLISRLNVSYCKVPKAGCTYWEQIFSFLSKTPEENLRLGIRTPFQISRYDIRYTSHFTLPRQHFKTTADRDNVMKSTRLLFTRHPLERLWSCYLEKFFLIEFWPTAGIAMKTQGAEKKCPKSITFREFVEYSLTLFNENWAPITELCNPCVLQPQVIGHVETFREDSHIVLRQLKMDWIVSEQEKVSREENQMLDMIIFNYQIHSIHWYNFYHNCLTQEELAFKLWEVFKKVGYLSSHAVLPDTLTDYNQTTIILELRSQYRKFPLSTINGRAQQLKMLKRDYDTLPKPLMAKLLEKYNTDFLLFGYNASLPTV